MKITREFYIQLKDGRKLELTEDEAMELYRSLGRYMYKIGNEVFLDDRKEEKEEQWNS
ncbi:MAG: hypothetical protein GF311_28340 [Candidatus Lokiarchaeota archaeon]|nr:hypothetical protein [Candidatus Lokiarchaeota archaeon]